MKKYNSVFTIAVSIDHDEHNASDITMEDIMEEVKRRMADVELVKGPEDTYENEYTQS